MRMSGGPASLNLKLVLLILAVAIAAGTLIYTQSLVKKLQERDRQIVELYAESFEYITESESDDLTFIFENIIQRIDFPLILTDKDDNIKLTALGGGYKNLEIDSSLTAEKRKEFLNEKIKELAAINPPIPVTYGDTLVLEKIYYGDSELVTRLKYYPYFQIVFAIIFILIAYVSFSHIKKSEQSNIWVGMAKETAHQLGTPISSLLGWTELLRLYYGKPEKVLETADEMDNDLKRLNKIAERFSKIGSRPDLKYVPVSEPVERVVEYIKKRIPQMGKKVTIEVRGDKELKAWINAELFEWVIENLTKNALDAIGGRDGSLIFEIAENKGHAEIEVTDNGKGIDLKRRKDVFRPGYSTKKRGWGLGLSLSKRIIENYHEGKIYVKKSVINEGTTFCIALNKAEPEK